MLNATFSILTELAGTNSTSEEIALEGSTKLYGVAKAHFHRGVESKQYRLMCVALMDSLKYSWDSKLSGETKTAWVKLFSALLVPLMKYSFSIELMYALNRSFTGSLNSFSFGTYDSTDGRASYNNDNEKGGGGGNSSVCYKDFEGLVDSDVLNVEEEPHEYYVEADKDGDIV